MKQPLKKTARNDENKLREAVSLFYAAVRADHRLAPIFAARVHDWDAHIEKITRFWSSVLLATGDYKGNPVARHYVFRHQLCPELFKRWETLWGQSLHQVFDADDVRHILRKTARISGSLQTVLFGSMDDFLTEAKQLHARQGDL